MFISTLMEWIPDKKVWLHSPFQVISKELCCWARALCWGHGHGHLAGVENSEEVHHRNPHSALGVLQNCRDAWGELPRRLQEIWSCLSTWCTSIHLNGLKIYIQIWMQHFGFVPISHTKDQFLENIFHKSVHICVLEHFRQHDYCTCVLVNILMFAGHVSVRQDGPPPPHLKQWTTFKSPPAVQASWSLDSAECGECKGWSGLDF